MCKEIETIQKRKVWNLSELPENVTPVGCRWVYTLKYNNTGTIIQYKARLVAQGFHQIYGESYEDTFSPVINFSLLRFFFTILVSYLHWTNIQCDVTGAYLYAPLHETVYMKQPPGFTEQGQEHKFCKLERAIYGLHQSGREWFTEIDKVLHSLGFSKFKWCNCAYYYGQEIILILYVDDFVLFGKTLNLINQIVDLIKSRFELKVIGQTHTLLGVQFEYVNNDVFLYQSNYISEISQRFREYKFPISSLPIAKGIVYSKSNCPQTAEEVSEMTSIPYRSLLGCISFLAQRTRPDICYAVNIFAQFQANPGLHHWHGLLRLLGYLCYTKDHKLKLSCQDPSIRVFSDADFAANRDDRTSLGGQLVLLGNSPIGWRTFKQKCVSLSTMEAEFVAITEAAKELLWFDRIIYELHTANILKYKIQQSILYADNQAAINFVKSPIENTRSKHIDVKLFFVRDLVLNQKFQLQYIRSKENLSDIFTKPPTKITLQHFLLKFFSKDESE